MFLKKNNIFINKNFTSLWISNLLSILGDQLTMISLPWLVLQLTDDVAAVGITLAIVSIPRAIFILLGGVLTDYFNPKNILIFARFASFSVLSILSVLIWLNILNLPILYFLALLLGLSSALSMPAMMSVLPIILKVHQLKLGNSITMATMQLSAVAGPILAGYIITTYSGNTGSNYSFSDAVGLAIVFLLDASLFLFSVAMLSRVNLVGYLKQYIVSDLKCAFLFQSLANGFQYMKQDKSLYIYLMYIAMVSFFIIGPANVGIPVLVEEKFLGTAADFGFLVTMQGAGMALGMFLAFFLPMPSKARFGMTIMALDFIAGVCVFIFAYMMNMKVIYSLLFTIGLVSGFIQVTVFTWVQMRIEQEYLGRMMSFLTFASLGLAPISSALAGYFIAVTSVTTMFSVAGLMLVLLSLFGFLNPNIRNMGVYRS